MECVTTVDSWLHDVHAGAQQKGAFNLAWHIHRRKDQSWPVLVHLLVLTC